MNCHSERFISMAKVCAASLAIVTAFCMISAARADEANAKALFKAMSDYLGTQRAISFEYDSNLEVVTKENQKPCLNAS